MTVKNEHLCCFGICLSFWNSAVPYLCTPLLRFFIFVSSRHDGHILNQISYQTMGMGTLLEDICKSTSRSDSNSNGNHLRLSLYMVERYPRHSLNRDRATVTLDTIKNDMTNRMNLCPIPDNKMLLPPTSTWLTIIINITLKTQKGRTSGQADPKH